MTWGARVVWIAVGAYALLCGAIVTIRWEHWAIGADTAIFTQVVLSAFSGFRSFAEGPPHFVVHFSPILALLYPLLAVARSGLALQYAQVVLVAANALVVFALVRPYVSDGIAARIGLIALLYPPLASGAVDNFHEVAFFPILASGVVWAADRRRWWAFALLGALALCVREDVTIQFLVIAAAAALWACRRAPGTKGLLDDQPQEPVRLARAAALFSVAALAVTVAYFYSVHRLYGAWSPGAYYEYSFGAGPAAVAGAIFLHPLEFARGVLTTGRLTYLLEALAPLVFLPTMTRWGLAAIPGLASVLLASDQKIWTMGAHYELLWAPWMVIAAAAALVHILGARGEAASRLWANLALAACAVFTLAANPMHPVFILKQGYADVPAARQTMACVPPGASLSTHEDWLAQVAANPRATMQRTDGVDYLVYADDSTDVTYQREIQPALKAALGDGRLHEVCSYGHVHAYTRLR